VTLDLPAEEGHAALEGSADDLHRLVLNLVENTFIHTPGGTPVVVSVRRDGDVLTLEVADRGPGVPADMRQRVFDRFTRRRGETAAGSGLGLSIVRAVADSHGGTVAVGEAEGGGAVFAVTLPASPLRSPIEGVREPEPRTATDPKEAEAT